MPEDVYRYYYERAHITAKEMANLICDNNPRKGSLKYRNSKFKNNYTKIRDTVKRGDIKFDGELTSKSKMDSKKLFEWAADKVKGFREKLPIDLIVSHADIRIVLPGLTIEASSCTFPSTYDELKQEYSKLWSKYLEIQKKNTSLQDEVDRLLVFEKQILDRRNKAVEASKHGLGKKKNT